MKANKRGRVTRGEATVKGATEIRAGRGKMWANKGQAERGTKGLGGGLQRGSMDIGFPWTSC